MTSLSLHWWMLRWKHKRLAPFLNLRSLHLGFRLAHNLKEIPPSQSQPMSQSNPFHKRETIKSSALPDYGLHSDRSSLEANSQFQQQSVQQTQLQPQQLQRAEPQAQEQVKPVPLQHYQVRPEKYPFPLGQSQQYLQPLPQLQGSVNTWQAPAQPYQDLQPSFYPNHPPLSLRNSLLKTRKQPINNQ